LLGLSTVTYCTQNEGTPDRADRGREVLAQGLQRSAQPRVEDILIAVVDGLKGFPEAIEAVFPKTTVQTCIVHLIRASLGHVGWKDRKLVAAALRPIYTPRPMRRRPKRHSLPSNPAHGRPSTRRSDQVGVAPGRA
jgi:hypothetical protein